MIKEYYLDNGFLMLLLHIVIISIIFMCIFLIIRVLVLWYWKIDHVVTKLDSIDKHLQEISSHLNPNQKLIDEKENKPINSEIKSNPDE